MLHNRLHLTTKATRADTNVSLSHKLSLHSIILLLLTLSQSSVTAVATVVSPTPDTGINSLYPSNHVNANSEQITDCPSYCVCTYQSSIQHLKISCKKPTNDQQVKKLNLGIKQLTLADSVLDYTILNQISQLIPKNSTQELNINGCAVDPSQFLGSKLLENLSGSLRKLHFKECTDIGTLRSFALSRGLKIQHFYELQRLESLSLQECGSGLSNLVMKTLPRAVHHITIVQSSVNYLDAEYFSYLKELRSLNLSHNEIPSVPYGLSQHLPKLRMLDVSNNEIEHLQEEVFVGLEELRTLHVNRNKIRYVDTEVFNPLRAVELIDLSHNSIIQIFEPYFRENKNLRILKMSDSWSWDSFTDYYKGKRSFTEMERLLATLSGVETLDISDNEMITIPETLAHAPQLKRVNMGGNPWLCSCQDRWVEYWIKTTGVSLVDHNGGRGGTIFCHSKSNSKQKMPFAAYMQALNCTDPNVVARTPIKYYGILERGTSLKCHTQRPNGPTITWVTPRKENIVAAGNNVTFLVDTNLIVDEEGTLFIQELEMQDFGLYLCIASYPNLNITHYVHLGMDTSIFLDVKLYSILVGLLTSFIFLFTVLTVQLIRALCERCGIDCMTNSGPSRTRRVRAFFESIEQNNTSQLDWLRDNYNMQAKRIRDNCSSQLERIRESYTAQTKNLSDIKYYGAQQLHTIRDQYYDQIRRVSSYSSQHLCKVRENYVFQRNRVSKFSSHQLLRLRETYKWQAQTLNKILENLPKTLNLDACRGMGACGRTDSMYLDDIGGDMRPLDGDVDVDVIMEAGSSGTSRGFENSAYMNGNGSGNGSDKMEHVTLLLPPQQMQRFVNSRFHLPPNVEATELVMIVEKHSGDSASRDDGDIPNGSVIIEAEEDQEEGGENDKDRNRNGDQKC